MAIKWSELTKTRYPGVRERSADGVLVVQVKQIDPRTGRRREIHRVMEPGTTIEEALAERA